MGYTYSQFFSSDDSFVEPFIKEVKKVEKVVKNKVNVVSIIIDHHVVKFSHRGAVVVVIAW